MKRLSMKFNIEGLELNEEDKKKSPIELMAIVVKNIILTWASKQGGLNEETRRIYYKISDVLDEAIKKEVDWIDLEDAWAELIKKCKKDAVYMPNLLWRRGEDLIDSMTTPVKEKTEKVKA